MRGNARQAGLRDAGERELGRRERLGRLGLGSGKREGEVMGRTGLCWVFLGLGLGSIFFLLSFPNYTQTKLNSNSNLNSTLALNQIKEMLQHDATTKIKPMIKF